MSRYAPRTEPKPIPTTAWNDAPLSCLEVNDKWVSHILGALNVLDQPDAWIGDDDEVFAARQQVNEIMLSLMPQCPKYEFSRFTDEIPSSGNDTNDGQVELGLSFIPLTYGQITAVKFYKRLENDGIHTAHVWDASATMLAEQVFTDETASGWQIVTLDEPVIVYGHFPLKVSVHMASGFYSYDRPVFTDETIAPPFVYEANAGMYDYGTSPTYPNSYFEASDYFIDFVFQSLLFKG